MGVAEYGGFNVAEFRIIVDGEETFVTNAVDGPTASQEEFYEICDTVVRAMRTLHIPITANNIAQYVCFRKGFFPRRLPNIKGEFVLRSDK